MEQKKICDWATGEALYFVAGNEGCRLTAYKPTPHDRWTIGFGNTYVYGLPVEQGQKITKTEALNLLQSTLDDFKQVLARLVTRPVSRGQFVALLDFIYNVGSSAFAGSTLLKQLNGGQDALAANCFAQWVYQRHWDREQGRYVYVVVPGLVNRRRREKAEFLSSK